QINYPEKKIVIYVKKFKQSLLSLPYGRRFYLLLPERQGYCTDTESDPGQSYSSVHIEHLSG
ncbi:MAG: hypothetical protein AAFX51_10860, partial [Cyanobacteria bacterium J06636_28]